MLDRHSQSVGDQRCRRLAIDRPADDASAKRVQHHGAVHLALASPVLCDVGDPELIAIIPIELPTNAVLRRGHVRHPPVAGPPRDALKASSTHQPPHGLSADGDSMTQRELCMHSTNAVDASGLHMHA